MIEKKEEKEEISEIKERNIFQKEIIDINEDDEEEEENEDELNETPEFSLEIWDKSECEEEIDDEDCESLEEGLDEERLTLGIIFRKALLSRKKKEREIIRRQRKG